MEKKTEQEFGTPESGVTPYVRIYPEYLKLGQQPTSVMHGDLNWFSVGRVMNYFIVHPKQERNLIFRYFESFFLRVLLLHGASLCLLTVHVFKA